MILIDGQILKVETLADKAVKVTIVTQELSGEKAGHIIGLAHQHVYFAIKVEAFTKADTDALETLKADYTDTTKSPSKRLRNVFFRLWEKDKESYEDFELYYNFKMTKLIEHYKGLLD